MYGENGRKIGRINPIPRWLLLANEGFFYLMEIEYGDKSQFSLTEYNEFKEFFRVCDELAFENLIRSITPTD